MRYLDEDWRPDRCGVLIDIVGGENQGIPPSFPQVALKFDVIDSPRVLNWDPLIRFIGSEIERGRPVFLGVPAVLGYERRKIFLNYLMANAVASRDRQAMVNALISAYQMGVHDAMSEPTVFSAPARGNIMGLDAAVSGGDA
jgi:hypothetical protein